MIAFRLLVMLCLLQPCFCGFFGGMAEKLGLVDKKYLQINASYVRQPAPSVVLVKPQLLSEAEPVVVSVETEDRSFDDKQILTYCLAGVSILLLIFVTLYCYEVNKEHSIEIERSYSFASPSQSTGDEESVSMQDLSDGDEIV